MADQKFQLRYSATEDRVLIISGTGPEDMRCFALTRRMVGQLWPGMNRIIAGIAPRTRQAPAEDATAARSPATAPQDSALPGRPPAAAAPAPAATAPAAPVPAQPDMAAENPFGNPPQDAQHLVRKLQLVDQGGGTRLLVLAGDGVALRLPLDSTQLVQIYDALRLIIERAEWAIDLDAGLPDAGAADPAANAAPNPAPDPAPDPATQDAPAPTIDISGESPSRYRH